MVCTLVDMVSRDNGAEASGQDAADKRPLKPISPCLVSMPGKWHCRATLCQAGPSGGKSSQARLGLGLGESNKGGMLGGATGWLSIDAQRIRAAEHQSLEESWSIRALEDQRTRGPRGCVHLGWLEQPRGKRRCLEGK